MTMQNLVVRIVLPPTFGLVNGATLQQSVTFEVASDITPWYCSIDQVRLEGGSWLRGLSDITISAMIYQAGRDSDAISYFAPQIPLGDTAPLYNDLAHQQVFRFSLARQRYTQLQAAYKLLLNVWDVNMNRGTKTLGNFSVSKSSQMKGEDVPSKLSQLAADAKEWEIVIKSAGHIGRGGRAQPAMAAKGLFDVDFPTGRTWVTTGMGANRKSLPGFGSQGKPVKFGSPGIITCRTGRFMGGHLSVLPKFVMGGGGY
jgi:hypothetical protein